MAKIDCAVCKRAFGRGARVYWYTFNGEQTETSLCFPCVVFNRLNRKDDEDESEWKQRVRAVLRIETLTR